MVYVERYRKIRMKSRTNKIKYPRDKLNNGRRRKTYNENLNIKKNLEHFSPSFTLNCPTSFTL